MVRPWRRPSSIRPRGPLDLVENHQVALLPEERDRIGEQGVVFGTLEVKIDGGALIGNVPSQCRLADLMFGRRARQL